MAFNLGDALKAVSYSDTGREQIEYIRLERIEEDPNNFYPLSDIDELASNIELCGLQQPIRVRSIEGTDRYMIVSGHRRRKAIELLAKENPEKWSEIPCIVELDKVSPAMQQLRLIYANSSSRTLKAPEISEQIVQVKDLLYKLKEEEGYEFPGRMRDHVAEIVKVSKSKLARLEVIRKGLAAAWQPAWQAGDLVENTAYELARMPKSYQALLFEEKTRTKANLNFLYADDVKKYAERCKAIVKMQCADCGGDCTSNCNTCSCGCGQHTPMEELMALMQYMVNHNTAHAKELADLAAQLEKMGNKMAYEQVMAAVSDFEKGNLRLGVVLASMEVK